MQVEAWKKHAGNYLRQADDAGATTAALSATNRQLRQQLARASETCAPDADGSDRAAQEAGVAGNHSIKHDGAAAGKLRPQAGSCTRVSELQAELEAVRAELAATKRKLANERRAAAARLRCALACLLHEQSGLCVIAGLCS